MSHEMANIHKEILIPNRVCVRGLEASTKEEDLHNIFFKFGAIIETKIIRDICNGESLGLGFVTFDSQRVAEHVVSTCNTMEINGREVSILPAKIQRIRKPKTLSSNSYSFNANISDYLNDNYLSPNASTVSSHIVPSYPMEHEVFYTSTGCYPVKNLHKDRCYNLGEVHHPFEVIDHVYNPNCVVPVYIPHYGTQFLSLNGHSMHTSTLRNQVHNHIINGCEDFNVINGMPLQNGVPIFSQTTPSTEHSRRRVTNLVSGTSSPLNSTSISRVNCSSPINAPFAPPPSYYRVPMANVVPSEVNVVEENAAPLKKENLSFASLVNFSKCSSKFLNVQDAISGEKPHKEQIFFVATAPGKVKRVVVN